MEPERPRQAVLAQGDAADVARLAECVLAIHQKALGPNHATVAENLGILARALRAQGDHVAAEPLLVRALTIHLGPGSGDDHADHPAVRALSEMLILTRTHLARH